MFNWKGLRLALAVLGAIAAGPVRHAFAQPPTGLPERWAVLVGINQYAAGIEVPDLKWAENDVDALEQSLKRDGYEVRTLKGLSATRPQIITVLQSLAMRLKPQDTFFLYIAGHGVRSRVNSKAYWLANDSTLAFLEASSLRLSHLMDYIADIKAGNKIVLLDHCFSGELVAELAGAPPLPPGPLATGVAPPGASRGPASGPQLVRNVEPVATTFRQQWTTDLGGTLVLGASRGDAYEIADKKHGLFTLSLLKALDSRAADKNPNDGKLSADELKTFVQTEVSSESRLLKLEQRVEDFNLGSTGAFFVMANLPAGSVAEATGERDRLRSLIADWYNKGYLDAIAQAECFVALGKAAEAMGSGVDPDAGVQSIVKAVRDAAGLTGIPEKTRAEILATNLTRLRGGQ